MHNASVTSVSVLIKPVAIGNNDTKSVGKNRNKAGVPGLSPFKHFVTNREVGGEILVDGECSWFGTGVMSSNGDTDQFGFGVPLYTATELLDAQDKLDDEEDNELVKKNVRLSRINKELEGFNEELYQAYVKN